MKVTNKPTACRILPLPILCIVLLSVSCVSRDYMQVFDFPEDRWETDQALVFTYHPADTLTDQYIDLIVRHRKDFPHRELRLEIKGITSDRRFWTDTVSFPLTRDKTGDWRGKSYSNHYDLLIPYRTGIRYENRGPRALSIRQIAGEPTLTGIAALGVVVSGATD